ncbi:MAG: dTDP-4-dehydrorhamnose 3,5-epimerase [Vicinamibacterales bacterium]
MRAVSTELPGVIVIEPDVHRDERGFFLETYHEEKYLALGIHGRFVQANHSRSIRNTIRGLHLQVGRAQAKLVRVLHGEIFDVAVDVRLGSPAFGRWVSVILTADNFRQCFIPAGFAHGFAVLSDSADVEYMCSDVYDRAAEVGIAWNDPSIGISWPVTEALLSARDRANPPLDAVRNRLPAVMATDL